MISRNDIDRSPNLREKYGVEAVPTFIVVDASGNEIDRTSGSQPAAQLGGDPRLLLDQLPGRGDQLVAVHADQVPAERAHRGPLDRRLRQRPQPQRVACGDQVDRGPHQRQPDQLHGDVVNPLTSTKVVALQNMPVSSTLPNTNGMILNYNSTANQWEPSFYFHNESPQPGAFLGLHLLLSTAVETSPILSVRARHSAALARMSRAGTTRGGQ